MCGVRTEKDPSTTRSVDLALFPYDVAGIDVQANFTIGGGQVVDRSSVASASYRPDFPSPRIIQGGTITHLTRIEGIPGCDLLVLLLARRDVRSARNGLWHLRDHLLPSVTDPSLRRILTYGRKLIFDRESE